MKVLCFGVAKDIVGKSSLEVDFSRITSVELLRNHLNKEFPEFKDYAKYRIAVNQSFAQEQDPISSQDEIAIIPPVSGG